MASTSSREETIGQVFDDCEKTVSDVEEGNLSKEKLCERIPETIQRLESLTNDISALSLFSDNEFFEELPTSSVKFLLVPCFRAICYLNMPFDPANRFQELKNAKLNFMEFLQKLQNYEVITFTLPWKIESDEFEVQDVKISKPSGDELRKEKLRRLEYDRNIKTALVRAKEDFKKNPDNDSALREIYLMQLRQWALRALSELEQIETELPLAKRMIGTENRPSEGPPKHHHHEKLKPFILTRNVAQKQVFGLGYPAIPTVTVDEWAKGMVEQGNWGNAPVNQRPNVEEEEESDSEERRQRDIRMDDYKDTHRRGWGNTHNKG